MTFLDRPSLALLIPINEKERRGGDSCAHQPTKENAT